MLISHVLFSTITHSLIILVSTHMEFLGERPSCDNLSLAYEIVKALISPNLYPQKAMGKREHIKINKKIQGTVTNKGV